MDKKAVVSKCGGSLHPAGLHFHSTRVTIRTILVCFLTEPRDFNSFVFVAGVDLQTTL